MVLPLASVLQDAIADHGDGFRPLVGWGAALAGVCAALGVATAAERTVRRGRQVVRLRSGGPAVAVLGIALAVAPTVVSAVVRSTESDEFVASRSVDGGGATLVLGSNVAGYVSAGGQSTYQLQGWGGSASITVDGLSGFDPQVAVLDPSGRSLGFDDDSAGNYGAWLSVHVDSGQSYTIVVTGYEHSAGDFRISVR